MEPSYHDKILSFKILYFIGDIGTTGRMEKMHNRSENGHHIRDAICTHLTQFNLIYTTSGTVYPISRYNEEDLLCLRLCILETRSLWNTIF
jgi:hypothetical protein